MENNPTITVNLFDHAKHVYGFEQLSMPWQDWAEFLTSGHAIRDDKDGTMFNCAMFANVEQTPKLHKSEQNVIGYSALVLDYDGHTTLADIQKLLALYEYVGYTSHRHHHPEKDYVDAFRIVLPLAKRVAKDDVTERRASSLVHFAGGTYFDHTKQRELPIVDRSSFSHSRAFYLPSCAKTQVGYAQAWWNQGQLFDLLSLPTDPKPITVITDDKPVTDDFKQHVADCVQQCQMDYDDWLIATLALASLGFTYEQWLNITHEQNTSTAKTVWNSSVRKAKTTPRSIGALINIAKRNNQWKPYTERAPFTTLTPVFKEDQS